MTIETQEKQVSRLAPLLHLITGVLASSGSPALSPDDQALLRDDLPTLVVMQRLAFRAIAQPCDENEMAQTPRINADFGEVMYGK